MTAEVQGKHGSAWRRSKTLSPATLATAAAALTLLYFSLRSLLLRLDEGASKGCLVDKLWITLYITVDALLFYAVGSVLYNLFLHPLRYVPGPLPARCTGPMDLMASL